MSFTVSSQSLTTCTLTNRRLRIIVFYSKRSLGETEIIEKDSLVAWNFVLKIILWELMEEDCS